MKDKDLPVRVAATPHRARRGTCGALKAAAATEVDARARRCAVWKLTWENIIVVVGAWWVIKQRPELGAISGRDAAGYGQ